MMKNLYGIDRDIIEYTTYLMVYVAIAFINTEHTVQNWSKQYNLWKKYIKFNKIDAIH